MKYRLPQEILKGIDLINNGEYYQAHEVLESAWNLESMYIRQLYQGLIQLSVALFHLEHGNFKGSLKLIPKVKFNISPFVNDEIAIDLKKLLIDLSLLEHGLQTGIDNSDNLKIHRPIFILHKTS